MDLILPTHGGWLGVGPRVGHSKRRQSGHFWRCARIALGAPLVSQGATSSADETISCETRVVELTRIASARAGAAACDCERGPQRAQQRPSTGNVGV